MEKKVMSCSGFLWSGAVLALCSIILGGFFPLPAMCLGSLAALFFAAWLSDSLHRRRTIGGWLFVPNVGVVLSQLQSVEVDASCMGLHSIVAASAAPHDFIPGLTLRAHSSSLLLSTAAALLAPAQQDEVRFALEAALAPLGMQPERIARRWPALGSCSVQGRKALLVQDGSRTRFFLSCTSLMDAPTPTHIFDQRESPVTTEAWHTLTQQLSDAEKIYHSLQYYFTGLWTDAGEESIVYLGCLALDRQPASAAMEALERLQRDNLPAGSGSHALLITRQETAGRPLQLICESAPPSSFADVLLSLRAQWKRRRPGALLPIFCTWLFSVMSIGLSLRGGSLLLPLLIAAAALPCLILGGRRSWQVRVPKHCLAFFLLLCPASLAAMLGYLPDSLLSQEAALGAAFAALAASAWGANLCFLFRQQGRRWHYVLASLLSWCVLIAVTAVHCSPLAVAFGAVLGALLQLPVWCLRFC